MISVLASSAVDRGFEHRSGQAKDCKTGICCFSAKHATLNKFLFGTGLNNSNSRRMNTHVFLVVESLPGRVHGGNLVNRELTPEQKTSAKFAVNIHDFFSFFGLLDYHIHV